MRELPGVCMLLAVFVIAGDALLAILGANLPSSLFLGLFACLVIVALALDYNARYFLVWIFVFCLVSMVSLIANLPDLKLTSSSLPVFLSPVIYLVIAGGFVFYAFEYGVSSRLYRMFLVLGGFNLFTVLLQWAGIELGFLSIDDFFFQESYNTVVVRLVDGEDSVLRPPGVFSNSGGAVIFSLAVFLPLIFFGRRASNSLKLVLLLLLFACVYISLTRRVWLGLALACAPFLFDRAFGVSLLNRSIGFIVSAMLVVFLLVIGLPGFSDWFQSADSGALSNLSMLDRLSQWEQISSVFGIEGILSSLFGYGYLQAAPELHARSFVLIDAMIFAMLLYWGIIGALLYLGCLFHISARARLGARSLDRGSLIYVNSVLVFFIVISLLTNFFNSYDGIIFLALSLGLISRREIIARKARNIGMF